MELKTAEQIIEEALNAAFLKGCYSLQDAKAIIKALEIIAEQNK